MKQYTVEEINNLNTPEPFCFETEREEQWFEVGLKYGCDAKTEQLSKMSIFENYKRLEEELLDEERRIKKACKLWWSNYVKTLSLKRQERVFGDITWRFPYEGHKGKIEIQYYVKEKYSRILPPPSYKYVSMEEIAKLVEDTQ